MSSPSVFAHQHNQEWFEHAPLPPLSTWETPERTIRRWCVTCQEYRTLNEPLNSFHVGESLLQVDDDADPEMVGLAITELRNSHQRGQERRVHWPTDYTQAMTKLARLFPTMRNVPGADPWNVELLIRWMNGPAPTSGSWHAGMFLLGVWNRTTNWKEFGLRVRKGRQGRFDLFAALNTWDEKHEAAFLEFSRYPFWP